MAIAPILAITAGEMATISDFPEKTAWMACHFSPYGLGLSNLPKTLPPGSWLMLDDVTPPHGHDPFLVARQLSVCVETLQCSGIVLDFQRPGSEETTQLAKHLLQALPCPVVVSDHYANDLTSPVLLPPVPPSVPLQEYLRPWQGREVWLELGFNGESITLTEVGSQCVSLPYPGQELNGFSEDTLHCHYSIETTETSASFTLWRTEEDLYQLVDEARKLSVVAFLGLHQELGDKNF